MHDFPEYDDLPDDPDVAFVQLYDRLSQRHQNAIRDLQDTRPSDVDFMNAMIGVASGLGIRDFVNWEIPSDWDELYPVFTNFERALARFAVETKVRKSRIAKVYSVHLSGDEKERIHSLIAKIREVVTASDLDDRKRNSLFFKLGAFESDVDRIRTRFDNAMLMSLEVIAVLDKGVKTLNPLNELLRRIQEIMSKAKDQEPEVNQLPTRPEQKQLESPQKKIEGPGDFSQDSGDDIPF